MGGGQREARNASGLEFPAQVDPNPSSPVSLDTTEKTPLQVWGIWDSEDLLLSPGAYPMRCLRSQGRNSHVGYPGRWGWAQTEFVKHLSRGDLKVPRRIADPGGAAGMSRGQQVCGRSPEQVGH